MHGSHAGPIHEKIPALWSLLAVRHGSVSSTSTPQSQLHMDKAMHVRTSFRQAEDVPSTVSTDLSNNSELRSAQTS